MAEGILLTNTRVLAEKYSWDEEDVVLEFEKQIREMQSADTQWYLLDIASYEDDIDLDDWLEYNNVISEFILGMGLTQGVDLSLFIIGGDDVIPVPYVEDVYGSTDEGEIPTDMPYSFHDNYFDYLIYGDIEGNFIEDVRNSVSRLPLEDGELSESDFTDDIIAYFQRCNRYLQNSIEAEHVVMTANESWLPASKTMSQHLPLICKGESDDFVEDKMFVSPNHSLDNEDSMDAYIPTINDAEMLVFNLHGSDRTMNSSFYNDYSDEGFSIEMLSNTEAKIFNTVACYGARFMGYDRESSMLLSAMLDYGMLLYMGSHVPVPMYCNVDDSLDSNPGSGSEKLMPIYCLYLYMGIPAATALLLAKIDYFTAFRQIEDDDFALSTILMFNLYGNPMLKVERNEEVIRLAREQNLIPTEFINDCVVSLDIPKRTALELDVENESANLLREIRGKVDEGWLSIHNVIKEKIEKEFGLSADTLIGIDKVKRAKDTHDRYVYKYLSKREKFQQKTWVEVDKNTSIISCVTTK